MSSAEDESYNRSRLKKKRKFMPACDSCKRTKRRCDEPIPPETKCSKCIERGVDCTFTVEPKKRGLPKGYVEELERKIQLLERLVIKLCPEKTLLYNHIYPDDPDYAEYLTKSQPPSSKNLNPLNSSEAADSPAEQVPKEEAGDTSWQKAFSLSLNSTDDPFRDDDTDKMISERLKTLSVKPALRFIGKSSPAMFLETALSFKYKHAIGRLPALRQRLHKQRSDNRESLYWCKDIGLSKTNYSFPPPDLITTLSDAYFNHVNLFYPLLHRPTFERGMANNLHLRDAGFGGVLLLVCAVGSRYTDTIDKRTLLDGETSVFSAGWKWFKQVQVVKLSILEPVKLYDLQMYSLAVHYLSGWASDPMWILTGFGLRLAQDVGAHRRRISRERMSVEDELWKRAFWVLLFLDQMLSAGTGRPRAINDEYFDLDMPIECDDEYWEHADPRQRFKQPEGRPSTVTAFNQYLRLGKIITFAMNTIYSVKSKYWQFVLKSNWEEDIVAELDSALDKWLNAIPEQLRWDPNITDERLFKLSGSLRIAYYYVQILIHRSFINNNGPASSRAMASLAICTKAAGLCARVLQHQMSKINTAYPYMQMACVTSGIMLLIGVWSGRRSGIEPDPITLELVERCKDVLRKENDRWLTASTMVDLMNELTEPDIRETSSLEEDDVVSNLQKDVPGSQYEPSSRPDKFNTYGPGSGIAENERLEDISPADQHSSGMNPFRHYGSAAFNFDFDNFGFPFDQSPGGHSAFYDIMAGSGDMFYNSGEPNTGTSTSDSRPLMDHYAKRSWSDTPYTWEFL